MERDLGRLTDRELDVLVVGGGIHGACAAWDATQRGLRTALVDAADFCGDTSWNSLKTIHGGLRYLQSLDLRRMRESIGDRRAWLRIAPALVRPLGFVVPARGHGKTGRLGFHVALALNDLIAADRNRDVAPERHIPRGRILGGEEARALVPGLAGTDVEAAALWYDAQVASSERLVIGLLHAAHDAGAALANYVRVTGLLRDGDRVVGAQIRDEESGGKATIRARVILSAAGPQTDRLLAMGGISGSSTPLLRAVNLVLRRRLLNEHALGARHEGRFLFMVPWGEHTIVGTGYRPHAEVSDQALANAFLAECQDAYPWAEIVQDDVALVHTGLVPGEHDAHGLWSRDRIRDHASDGAPGLVSVLGVKFTTARAVAEAAIDRVSARLGSHTRCRTSHTPLPWARMLDGSIEEMTRIAVTEEMARHVGDVILRRAELGTAGPPAPETLEAVVTTMARLLDWDAQRTTAERHSGLARFDVGRVSSAAQSA